LLVLAVKHSSNVLLPPPVEGAPGEDSRLEPDADDPGREGGGLASERSGWMVPVGEEVGWWWAKYIYLQK